MPTIDDSLRRIDNVICRHLDEIESSSRGAISQDILEQLIKLVNHIMLKFYAGNVDIPITDENIEKAARHAQVTSELTDLYKFRKFLKSVNIQYTLDEDGSERLMLKYYQFLLEAKNLLRNYYGIEILHNLNKFPLKQDKTLQEYYEKIKEKLDNYRPHYGGDKKNKYYIQKSVPRFVNKERYFSEITFTPVGDKKNQSKAERVIAFTQIPINKRYACKFHIVDETIEILGKTLPIRIIDGWEVDIRECEFNNFMKLVTGRKEKVTYAEQRAICKFLTTNTHILCDLMDFEDEDYAALTTKLKAANKTNIFITVLDHCREIIRNNQEGGNVLRYLLYHMNNVIIKGQRSSEPNDKLSNLYLKYGCKPFDSQPFNKSLIEHNPKASTLFECIPTENREPELLARHIRNNTENKGYIFTDINSIVGYEDIPSLIRRYNRKLYFKHKEESSLKLEYDQVFINGYKNDTCQIIEKLKELSSAGVEDYEGNVDIWLLLYQYVIDCQEKKDIVRRLFSSSRVGVIYGSAGVGKSTLINHVSHFLDDKPKLYLTQTNPAKENLTRRIDANNTEFSTIASFLSKWPEDAEYELLVIDECSTVSNRDMVAVLQKANFNMLLLVGDTYQIDAIQFGNWFSALKYFLPSYAIFELKVPYRTKNPLLLQLWDKVRHMDDDVKEIIQINTVDSNIDTSLLAPAEPDEAILCLNYDGLYGINNINRFLQESNPNPAVTWDVQQYKVGDPILFLEATRFHPIIYNNMKGIIRGVEILNEGTYQECIQFDIEIPKEIDEEDAMYLNLQRVRTGMGKSLITFCVYKSENVDEDNEEEANLTTIPFQIAYAVSIHKSQGLEYNSVKIVITDEVEELVTHDVFYTAITRAREKLKIYWTPEVEEKVLNRIRPRDISNDVEILKNYLKE